MAMSCHRTSVAQLTPYTTREQPITSRKQLMIYVPTSDHDDSRLAAAAEDGAARHEGAPAGDIGRRVKLGASAGNMA